MNIYEYILNICDLIWLGFITHMNDNLSIAVHAFASSIWISFSGDETLLRNW